MTPLEASVAIAVVAVPAVSAMWLRRCTAQDAKVIRDEAAAAVKTLKDEAAAATLTAREAAVASRENGVKLDGVTKQLDGRLTQFMKALDERQVMLEQRIEDALHRGVAIGRNEAINGQVEVNQEKIEEHLTKQDAKSEARHEEIKNGPLNGTKGRKP